MFTDIQGSPTGKLEKRGRGRPKGRTRQGDAAREDIYRATIESITSVGYESTTLRSVAKSLQISPALLYRYFPSKGAVVLELYDRLAIELAGNASAMKRGTWRSRVTTLTKIALERLRPHREAILALTPLLLGNPKEGIFSTTTAFSRETVQALFTEAVSGATDSPRDARDKQALGRGAYLAYLGVVMWWLLDRSEDQKTTATLLSLLEKAFTPLSFLIRLPKGTTFLRTFDKLYVEGLLGGEHR